MLAMCELDCSHTSMPKNMVVYSTCALKIAMLLVTLMDVLKACLMIFIGLVYLLMRDGEQTISHEAHIRNRKELGHIKRQSTICSKKDTHTNAYARQSLWISNEQLQKRKIRRTHGSILALVAI